MMNILPNTSRVTMSATIKAVLPRLLLPCLLALPLVLSGCATSRPTAPAAPAAPVAAPQEIEVVIKQLEAFGQS